MRSFKKQRKYGYEFKTRLEMRVADFLDANDFKWDYEAEELEYWQKVAGICGSCGSDDVYRTRVYLPDFRVELPEGIIYLEAKGAFTREDRSKHMAIKDSHPDEDIRFIFQRDNWITKAHAKKYSGWCEQKGFNYIMMEDLNSEWILKRTP